MSKITKLPYGRDAIRVRVKKSSYGQPSDDRKFCIDPEITTFSVLQTIIAKAFDIKGDFALSYRFRDDYGQEDLMPLCSDWDLDAAFLSASDPYLFISINAKNTGEQSRIPDERCPETAKDVFGTIEITRTQLPSTKTQNRLPGLIMNRMEKTLNIFQRAFNMGEESAVNLPITPTKPPLTDIEFRKLLNPIGQTSNMKELRSRIYFGGIEPGLRKVVWKHILNVYPQGMSASDRISYMKRKTQEYEALRETWRSSLQKGHSNEDLAYVTSMVRKDVLRTDRHHVFYAGHDDNQNIASLFNILTTYALNHPSVSYCQGMSDLASPLLVTMTDEAHAYICFCALMSRLKPNFMLDEALMTIKFQHLTEGLMLCDPQFYAYLKMHQAEDLLFCYRWLLLEMKREFAFDDALHMLEVLWSSLEASPPATELPLFEVKFAPHSSVSSPPISPLVRTIRETPYTKVCAIRRQSSSMSLNSFSSARKIRTHRQNQSLDEDVITKQNRLRKHGRIKPFFSLDDNCIEMKEGSMSNSQSATVMHGMGEADPLVLMKMRVNSMKENKNNTLSSSTGSLIETTNRRASKRLIDDKNSSSLNKLQFEKENDGSSKGYRGKTIKNLNEFLNLASRGAKTRQRSQCSSISESDVLGSPKIAVTRSRIVSEEAEVGSDVESDRSSKHVSSPSFSSSVSPNVFEAQMSDDIDSSPDAINEPGALNYRSDSSPDDSTEYCPVTTSMTRELRLELEHLDRNVLGLTQNKTSPSKVESDVFVWENPIELPTTPDEQRDLDLDGEGKTSDENGHPAILEEHSDVSNFLTRSALATSNILHSLMTDRSYQKVRSPAQAFSALPPPDEFGGGNPFLMFLCLTLLRQHRDFIMNNQMDYNEMAMHFDKMVRKHNVCRVLEEARQMFATYLKQQSLQTSQNSKLNFSV